MQFQHEGKLWSVFFFFLHYVSVWGINEERERMFVSDVYGIQNTTHITSVHNITYLYGPGCLHKSLCAICCVHHTRAACATLFFALLAEAQVDYVKQAWSLTTIGERSNSQVNSINPLGQLQTSPQLWSKQSLDHGGAGGEVEKERGSSWLNLALSSDAN